MLIGHWRKSSHHFGRSGDLFGDGRDGGHLFRKVAFLAQDLRDENLEK